MFDRLFMPALTFTLLVAGFAAFASEIAQGAELQRAGRAARTRRRERAARAVGSASWPAPKPTPPPRSSLAEPAYIWRNRCRKLRLTGSTSLRPVR